MKPHHSSGGFAALIAALALAGSPLAQAPSRTTPSSPAAEPTREAHAAALRLAMPYARELEFVQRGFIATRSDPIIRTAAGGVSWNLDGWKFLEGSAPATVNPQFWRQSQLLSRHGLFRVAEGVYQVRGFDAANIGFVRGKRGWIVIDPLLSEEPARAALELVREKLGAGPVTAVIYSHSHGDHFAGVGGVVSAVDVRAGKVPVIAPAGFLEHAVSENVLAGNAMVRRANYQFGARIPRGPQGQISSGIGLAMSLGTRGMIPPTRSINRDREVMTVDGVRMEFHLTPGAEAPAEMNIFFLDQRALFMAENANVSMHNLLPPRGALVRDAKAWADHLTQALRRYAPESDVVFGGHGWPRFGRAEVADYLANQRDAYKYLHDQTVRMMNQGLTGSEIAERLRLPEPLARPWYNRNHYGTLATNARAVYQRYMGWYDANPASLNPLPRTHAARRYVAAMGGPARVLAEGRRAVDAGEYRWAAEVLNHLVFADPQNQAARDLLALAYDQLGYQSESGQLRNVYLSGALELREGVARRGAGEIAPELVRNTPTGMLLDLMAVRLNPGRAAGQAMTLQLVFPDRDEQHLLTLRNSVLVHEPVTGSAPPGPS
jgi:alkyl sulfatase BDS1-like metallo-beta-lactamase superfamily hydrolase